MAKKIFSVNQVNYTEKDQHLTIAQENIFKIQDELFKSNIHLIEMTPVEVNLEQIVIDILDKERG